MTGGNRGWILRGALLLCLAPPLHAQAPYVPDVTEAREKEWRKLVAASQAAYASGNPADGVDPARRGLALADELFGADDPRTLISANDLALQLEATGRYREAEGLYRRVFDSYLRTRGEDDPNTQLAVENLVDFYIARKRYDAAEPLADYAVTSFRRTTGSGSARSRRMEQILAAMPRPAPPIAAAAPTQPSGIVANGAMNGTDGPVTSMSPAATHENDVEKAPSEGLEATRESGP
ncbi:MULTISPECIES: tetratricopeptide repeat protein [Sphingobium]|uniref:Kinesin light chain n=1 Tax=Sphingobium fuliginis (strain ATCC 27551) TaxID=336203 RepID=A0A292ZFT9_SPHSA|nr:MULTISPECIES: tetratricopeptide repeat protein [Sphingobium]QOT72381.1 tetratricopeptide repeat protein [Sphingobium fuliginis]GAY21695.1 kinesin light chain [Sphingobium fuliginis]